MRIDWFVKLQLYVAFACPCSFSCTSGAPTSTDAGETRFDGKCWRSNDLGGRSRFFSTGCDCPFDQFCSNGACLPSKSFQVCAAHCVDDSGCGEGERCVVHNGGRFCAYMAAVACNPCALDAQCSLEGGLEGAACVSFGPSGNFCAFPCTDDGRCPSGNKCAEITTSAGKSMSQCVPESGVCTRCRQWAGGWHWQTACSLKVGCVTHRFCLDDGTLTDCYLPLSLDTSCDGNDDDCDGKTDEEASCDDSNVCTEDSCKGAAGCDHLAKIGADCDDGQPCTNDDKCVGFETSALCLGTVVCDDGKPCTLDYCPFSGVGCAHKPHPDDTACVDKTGSGKCVAGVCKY